MDNIRKKQQLIEIKELCAVISHSIEQRYDVYGGGLGIDYDISCTPDMNKWKDGVEYYDFFLQFETGGRGHNLHVLVNSVTGEFFDDGLKPAGNRLIDEL